MIITSPANEKLKHARRVRDGREPDLIFIEGERLIESCLESPLKLVACFHPTDLTKRSEAIVNELRERDCPTHATIEAVLATVSDTVNPQGIILIAERPRYMLSQVLTAPLLVGIDAVQDPGNFGAIVRTAEAAGAGGILALKGSVEAFAPKTLRSAMGSAFRLPILTDVESEDLLQAARRHGLRVVATSAAAETVYTDYDWRQSSLVFFGNEGNGVSPELLERSDVQLRIPLCAPVESLNVAAAAAAILFEGARQRRSSIVQ